MPSSAAISSPGRSRPAAAPSLATCGEHDADPRTQHCRPACGQTAREGQPTHTSCTTCGEWPMPAMLPALGSEFSIFPRPNPSCDNPAPHFSRRLPPSSCACRAARPCHSHCTGRSAPRAADHYRRMVGQENSQPAPLRPAIALCRHTYGATPRPPSVLPPRCHGDGKKKQFNFSGEKNILC